MSCSKSLKRAPGKGEGREEKNVLVSYKSMKLTEASHSKESTSPSASLRAKLRAGRGGRRGSAGSGHKGPYTSCKNTEASLKTYTVAGEVPESNCEMFCQFWEGIPPHLALLCLPGSHGAGKPLASRG